MMHAHFEKEEEYAYRHLASSPSWPRQNLTGHVRNLKTVDKLETDGNHAPVEYAQTLRSRARALADRRILFEGRGNPSMV
jgi:hypothetical protein